MDKATVLVRLVGGARVPAVSVEISDVHAASGWVRDVETARGERWDPPQVPFVALITTEQRRRLLVPLASILSVEEVG